MAYSFPSLLANTDDQVAYNFRFQINSTSDPDHLIPNNARVKDITRVSAGLFDITFNKAYAGLLTFRAGLLAASASGVGVELVSYNTSTGVMRIRTVAATPSLTTTPAATAAPAWLTDIAVSSDACTMANAGHVIAVHATTASVTGPKSILSTGAPATTQCTVAYTAGVATITFNGATDAVTACSVCLIRSPSVTATTSGTAAGAVADPADDDWVQVSCVFAQTAAGATNGSI